MRPARGAASRIGRAFTPAEDRVVEDAVRFILDRARLEELEFAIEVGEHLFVKLFRSDLDLYRSNDPHKAVAMTRIARDPRVGMNDRALHDCVHTYLLVRRWGRSRPGLPAPRVDPESWSRMWDLLEEDDEVFFRVLAWVAREKVSHQGVSAVVQTVGPYVEAGGKVGDILVEPPRGGYRTPYSKVMRLLGVERKWLVAGLRPGSAATRKALALVADIESRLVRNRAKPRPRAGRSPRSDRSRGRGGAGMPRFPSRPRRSCSPPSS